jgi:endoglucanase
MAVDASNQEEEPMNRRDWLNLSLGYAAAGIAGAASFPARGADSGSATQGLAAHGGLKIPRWRGFNLVEKLSAPPDEYPERGPEWGRRNEPFLESDFEWIAELGFNFVRLPMSPLCWTDPKDPSKFLEKPLGEIDQAVAWGRRLGVHVNLGFCGNHGYYRFPSAEKPTALWKDPKVLDDVARHWRHFAQRYKGIPGANLSFNLDNEPGPVTEPDYVRVVTRLVKDIREEDPGRMIIADGRQAGMVAVNGLAELGIVQSYHAYEPWDLTHYHATWMGYPKKRATVPSWPLRRGDQIVFDKDTLRKRIKPWAELSAKGAAIHVGEMGCYRYTSHDVAMGWMRDMLGLIKEAGWGWALWCFRGSFGILDSQRDDVKYEMFHGHRLDRQMLELLRQS